MPRLPREPSPIAGILPAQRLAAKGPFGVSYPGPNHPTRTPAAEGEGWHLSLADALHILLPELLKPGSIDAVFGRPLETGGIILIPVARLAVGVLGLDGSPRSGLGGGVSLEPVAVIVIKDREVTVKRLPGVAPDTGAFSGDGLDTVVGAIRGVLARTGGSAGHPGREKLVRSRPPRRRRSGLEAAEEQEEQTRPHHVADRGHRESQGEPPS